MVVKSATKEICSKTFVQDCRFACHRLIDFKSSFLDLLTYFAASEFSYFFIFVWC